MIAYLRGKVIHKDIDSLIIDVQGVGYKVFVGENILSSVGNTETELFCHHHQRETSVELYGFASADTLRLFSIINNISGIGPKLALILSSLGTIDELKKAIEQRDEKFFAGVRGLGKKRLQKLILELTGKLDDVMDVTRTEIDRRDEVLQALVGLGFTVGDARDAISQVNPKVTDPEGKIKEALKVLGK
jgi:Holliday junction DNA helicase RuvA